MNPIWQTMFLLSVVLSLQHPSPIAADQGNLAWCTFLGGDATEEATAVASRSDGTVYVTGLTSSAGFPTTSGAYDISYSSAGSNAFVTRLSPSGAELVYSTYLGGGSYLADVVEGRGIVVDQSGHAYVIGFTTTPEFPTTPGAFNTIFGGASDVFVVKLHPLGNILRWSTFLGGSDAEYGYGIAIDENENAYLAGSTSSDDFPVTPGAFDTTYSRGNFDAFAAKLNASGSALAYASYIGGTSWDHAQDIAVDKNQCACLCGQTGSGNFHTTPGAWDHSLDGAGDAFAVKLNAQGSDVIYSTYLGGGDWDQADGIDSDSLGQAYLVGNTKSMDFPTTAGAFDRFHGGLSSDAFVVKLNSSGTQLSYATFLGGESGDSGHDIAVDDAGRAYITGETQSADFPTTAGAADQTFNGGPDDVFMTVLNTSGSGLLYSTFLGGAQGYGDRGNAVAIDHQGGVFIVGKTSATDFPVTAGAFDNSHNGSWDVFVAKWNPGLTPVADTNLPARRPQRYEFDQNYPNPFNATTQIRYALPGDGRVSLRVYNIHGQAVAVLADARQMAGWHTIRWNATDLASGVYFCILTCDDFKATKKMILLK